MSLQRPTPPGGRGHFHPGPPGYFHALEIERIVSQAGRWRRNLSRSWLRNALPRLMPGVNWQDRSVDPNSLPPDQPYEGAWWLCLPEDQAAEFVAKLIAYQRQRHAEWEKQDLEKATRKRADADARKMGYKSASERRFKERLARERAVIDKQRRQRDEKRHQAAARRRERTAASSPPLPPPPPSPLPPPSKAIEIPERDQRILDAWHTYSGPMHWRHSGLPKIKGREGFRKHSGVEDCRLADLRRLLPLRS